MSRGPKPTDMAGRRFGRLVVQEAAPVRISLSGRRSAWHCLCDCGARTTVTGSNLRAGQVRSCGCGRRGKTGRKPLDLTGQRFGRLLVGERAPDRHGHHRVAWHCLCDCGAEAVVTTTALRSGNTRSCGCGRGRRL
jgi:hypothetical protein